MTDAPELSPEYRAYLERRYVDIKQVLEAVLAFHPYEAIEENHLIDTLEGEFDYIAVRIDMPELGECLERWIAADAMDDDDID